MFVLYNVLCFYSPPANIPLCVANEPREVSFINEVDKTYAKHTNAVGMNLIAPKKKVMLLLQQPVGV